MNSFTIRKGKPDDYGFLKDMLYEAACWRPDQPRPPRDEVLQDPHIVRYVEGWGRPGDAAVIATAGDCSVGAAWYQLFSE